MTSLHSWKIQGQTAANAAINTVAVSYNGNGSLTFTDSSGTHRSIQVGYDGDLARLLKEIFTGTGGWTTGQNPPGAP